MPCKSTKVTTVLVPRVVGGENMGIEGDLLKSSAPYMENSTNQIPTTDPMCPRQGWGLQLIGALRLET